MSSSSGGQANRGALGVLWAAEPLRLHIRWWWHMPWVVATAMLVLLGWIASGSIFAADYLAVLGVLAVLIVLSVWAGTFRVVEILPHSIRLSGRITRIKIPFNSLAEVRTVP